MLLPVIHEAWTGLSDYAFRHIETLKLVDKEKLSQRVEKLIQDWEIKSLDDDSRPQLARIVMFSFWELHPLRQRLTRQMEAFEVSDDIAKALANAWKLLPERLIESNWELVRKAAAKYHIPTHLENEAEFQELMSVGREALFLAAQKYFKRPKGPFKNFAWSMLRERMRDEQMNRHPVPPSVRKKLAALKRLREDYHLRDLSLTEDVIRKELKLSPDESRELLATEAVWGTGQAFENDHVLEELEEPDHSLDQLQFLLQVEDSIKLEEALGTLDSPEAAVIRLVYFKEKSFREVAEELDMSIPAFKRLHRKALEGMRDYLENDEI